MELAFFINLICFLVLLFTLIINPLLFVIGLIPIGFIQVITSLYYLSKRDSLSIKNQKLLSFYFFIVFGWLILIVLGSILPNNLKYLVEFLGFGPIIVAIYFIYISHKFCEN